MRSLLISNISSRDPLRLVACPQDPVQSGNKHQISLPFKIAGAREQARRWESKCRLALIGALLLGLMPQAWAYSWQDLWVNKNRQAQALMDKGQFSKAQQTFEDPAWQATAAYRAGNYKEAVTGFQSIKNNADAYYNQANALAHSGQLEPALKAFDNALALDPTNQDASHNRKVVEELLKKQKQNKHDQDKQKQEKQEKKEKQDQDKQDQNKQDQYKKDQDKKDQDKKDKQKKPAKKSPDSQADREQKQAKEQWLHLIPDDPGGLMREKFLRDYLRRHSS